MKSILILIFLIFNLNSAFASNELMFFLDSAHKNNPKLQAERKNLKSIKENLNISISEFLPSINVSGDISSEENSNRKNQAGENLNDSNIQTETKTISVDQKIFQGFEGVNSIKKSKLESKQAISNLKRVEQDTLLSSIKSYYDLVYKIKLKQFNSENVDLFERQVESDSARLQKGEITLTDLAQSESSLAGAGADLISAETDLITTKANFERITRVAVPKDFKESAKLKLKLPNSLLESLKISELNNPKLIIAKLDYEIAKKDVSIKKAKLSPSASINYSKSENTDFSSAVDKIDQETLKATVSWPIISGGKNYSTLKKSKFQKEKSNLILQDVKNEVKTDTANAWSVYQSSKSVLKATKSQLEAAEIANEGITLEYDSGDQRTTLDVIQSRTFLLSAKINNAKAERDFVISQFKLLDVLGNLTLKYLQNI
jgi:outer membrane protein